MGTDDGACLGMNKTFLVHAKVNVHYYMRDRAEVMDDFRIVLAPDEVHALTLVEDYWRAKNDEYCVTYLVHSTIITETLVWGK